jgi:hypothetical protein
MPASGTPLRHLFETFARTGLARAVVNAFNDQGLFSVRVRTGDCNGELAFCATGVCCAPFTTRATRRRSSMVASAPARTPTARSP